MGQIIMNKPRIGILTNFTGSDSAFSLCGVVKIQLSMLHEAGYNPILLVAPTFAGEGVFSDKQTEIRRLVNPDASKTEILEALRPAIADLDILL